jgi:hypothetical protein
VNLFVLLLHLLYLLVLLLVSAVLLSLLKQQGAEHLLAQVQVLQSEQ